MTDVIFDSEVCRGCGTCGVVCPAELITIEKKHAKRLSNDGCLECFHCVAACPNGAVAVSGFPHETITANTPFLSRRSCRSYTSESVDHAILASLAVKANQAPRASPPNARHYVFLTKAESLSKLRNALAHKIYHARKLLGMLSSLPILPKKTRGRLRRLFDTVKMASKRIKTGWDMFHGAPVLVLVTGSGAQGVSKEDGVYAMQQLLLLAEAEGLGSCVSGYPAGFSKVTNRTLGLPKGDEVLAAAMLGYPTVRFNRAVLRGDTKIQWL